MNEPVESNVMLSPRIYNKICIYFHLFPFISFSLLIVLSLKALTSLFSTVSLYNNF